MTEHKGHVADEQPYAHLFTVSLDEVRKRVTSGSKYAGKKRPNKKEAK